MAELIPNEFVRYSVGSKEVWIPPSEPHYPPSHPLLFIREMDEQEYDEWRVKWNYETATWRTHDAGRT